MNFISLVATLCRLADPTDCFDERITFENGGSMTQMQLMMSGQQEIAKRMKKKGLSTEVWFVKMYKVRRNEQLATQI